MKIARCQVFHYRLQLTEPLTLGAATIEVREGFLIRLCATDHISAWGEAAPLPGFSRESMDEVLSELQNASRTLLDMDVPADNAALDGTLSRLLAAADLSPSTRCGLEMALLNLAARERQLTLAALLSPQSSPDIRLNALITDIKNATIEAERLVRKGYRTLKLKVGRQSTTAELDAVRAIRSTVGDRIALRLDANRAWSYDQAAEFAAALSSVSIEYIEEPCRTLRETIDLTRLGTVPVALDESLIEIIPERLSLLPAPAALILKPTLLGGFYRCAALAHAASDVGAKTVISSSFESSVGIGALVQLAAAIGSPGIAHGLETLSRLAEDVTVARLAPRDGGILIDEASDIAQQVDESRLTLVYDSESEHNGESCRV